MKHRVKKQRLGRPTAERKALTRALLTSLATHGQITTTAARARVVAAEMDHLIATTKRQPTEMLKIRTLQTVLYTPQAQRNLLENIIPKLPDNQSGFVQTARLTPRAGDNAPRTTIVFSTIS